MTEETRKRIPGIIERIDELRDEVEKIHGAEMEELQARDRGSYHAIDYEADNAFTRALNRINYRRNVNEIYSL